MSEWREVTSPSELHDGQQIACWDTERLGGYGRREGTKVIWRESLQNGIKQGGHPMYHPPFTGWKHTEALFDDDAEPTPKRPAATDPTHLGYEWDGVTYRDNYIGERTLTEHVDHIAGIRKQLAEANKQLRRYRTLEKRGLK